MRVNDTLNPMLMYKMFGKKLPDLITEIGKAWPGVFKFYARKS
jgi:hypothetical protein